MPPTVALCRGLSILASRITAIDMACGGLTVRVVCVPYMYSRMIVSFILVHVVAFPRG